MTNNDSTILIVEDNEGWRILLTEILEQDFSVKSVSTYDDAIKALWKQTQPFHVVVMDVNLDTNNPHGEHGLDLTEELKRKAQNTKVIVVTGQSKNEQKNIERVKRALRDLDVFEYLLKYPFDHKAFKNTVHRAFEDAQKRIEPEVDREALFEKICAHFSKNELRELCFILGIPFGNLEGGTERAIVISLIEYCERRGLYQALIDACQKGRPGVDW